MKLEPKKKESPCYRALLGPVRGADDQVGGGPVPVRAAPEEEEESGGRSALHGVVVFRATVEFLCEQRGKRGGERGHHFAFTQPTSLA